MSTTDYPNGYVGAEYVCHKRVRAAKITAFEPVPLEEGQRDPSHYLLHFESIGVLVPAIKVAISEVRGIEAGGYLVQYVDGYRSFSPAKAFEEGYSRIAESTPPKAVPWCEGCGD